MLWILIALGLWELLCVILFVTAVIKIGPPISGWAWLVGLTFWPIVLNEIWSKTRER